MPFSSRPPFSFASIIPPIIMQNVARNGTSSERDMAIHTLGIGESFRAYRAAQLPTLPSGVRRMPLMAQATMMRSIYDADHKSELPGRLVRTEGAPPTGDPAVDEAYDGLGAVWTFYNDVYDRNSIDDRGMAMLGVVHFGKQFDNAFWDTRQMVFGDGGLFKRFTAAVDVIGHELAHGVTHYETGLNYFQQSGALNESISDVFGIMVKQRVRNLKADESDWIIGAELFKGTTLNGVGLRSMKAPGTAYDDPVLGKDPQPGHMQGYVKTFNDNGGVHINSGIPNHAFYRLAVALGGYAWEKAGRIWYETLRDPKIRRNSGFTAFARQTIHNAGVLFGVGSVEQKAVNEAWRQVGVQPK